jgi:hypothetical protein
MVETPKATSLNLSGDEIFGVDKDDSTIYHSRSGVTLKLRAVSAMLIARRAQDIPMPEPPVIVDDRGREEANLASPSYLKALREYDEKISFVNMGTMFLFGTSVLALPDDFPRMEDKSWSDPLENRVTWGESAMTIPTDHDGRYIFWMTYIVLNHDIEIVEVPAQIRILGGSVPMQAVKDAEDSFRNLSKRDTNTGVGATTGEQRGPNRATRRRNGK